MKSGDSENINALLSTSGNIKTTVTMVTVVHVNNVVYDNLFYNNFLGCAVLIEYNVHALLWLLNLYTIQVIYFV